MAAIIDRPDGSVWVHAFASGERPGEIALFVQEEPALYLTAVEAKTFAEDLLTEARQARSDAYPQSLGSSVATWPIEGSSDN